MRVAKQVNRRLKMEMVGADINQKYLAKRWDKSATYVSHRFMGKQPFNIDEIYDLCDLLKIPYEEIQVYFPRNGADASTKAVRR